MTAAAPADVEILDALIAGLEALIIEAEEAPLAIRPGEPPRRAAYRPVGAAAANMLDRKPRPAEAFLLEGERLILHCSKTDAVRLMTLAVDIQIGKTGRGEQIAAVNGVVNGLRRISGGYEMEIRVAENRRVAVTPAQKLRECVENGDMAGWNRWCLDIKDSLNLEGVNLAGAELTGYDFCCADFSNADLSNADLSNAILAGANLASAKLENVKIGGADLFRARMARRYAPLLAISGMPEVESVIFADEDGRDVTKPSEPPPTA